MKLVKGMMVAASAAFVVAMANGCSSTVTVVGDPDSGAKSDTGATADTGAKKDSSVTPPVDAGDPGSCKPGDTSSFMPVYVPAAKIPGACTAQAISDYDAKCLNSATAKAADCKAWQMANASCDKCLVTPDTAAKFGPIVFHTGTLSINIAGCFEINKELACASSLQAVDGCHQAACAANCPVSDDASFKEYVACTKSADSVVCKKYTGPADTCGMADSGAVAKCLSGQTFDDLFLAVAPQFCL